MIILIIRTDKPEAEIGLYDDAAQLSYQTWQAHRELGRTIHVQIRDILQKNGKDWPDIAGIVAFRGPGSFTGLRIGLTVANALAEGNNCPVVGVMGEDWQRVGIESLLAGESDTAVMPEYGAEAHITQQRK
jgi:tRNA threonylcarbamoyladenosine biosynthesis protein TsaB